MATKAYWESVYRRNSANEVSWYRLHLEESVKLIQQAAPDCSAAIIDVGGGESTLVDDLLTLGYQNVSVLDISSGAIQATQQRLGKAASTVEWLVGDITKATLPNQRYAVWHDRAVFHFLVNPAQQAAYIQQILNSLTKDGHLVMAVFGPDSPKQCSGLEVVRHDIELLCKHVGPKFELINHSLEEHHTPRGKTQQFLYAHFRFKGSKSS